MINYLEIGQRIAKIRNFRGLTQAEVCEKCNISDKYLSNIERAKSIPSVEILMRICDVLDVTPDKILIGSNKNIDENLQSQTAELLKLLDDKNLIITNKFIKLLAEEN